MRRVSNALTHRYAKALFEVAAKANALAEVQADLSAITAAWDEHPEFAQLALNPRLSRARVKALLHALADRAHAQPLTRDFLDLLLEKRRLEILQELSPHFDRLWRQQRGEVDIRVTTAVPVAEPMRQTIVAHLKQRSGKIPRVTWSEDPQLLGGLVVEWPDRVFDGSLARKLDNLRATLALADFTLSQ
ncbi:MAG: ATP synthase F1 subunit delta [bacterium]|nr:ATP synthase F1 subunit delta [bacterium]